MRLQSLTRNSDFRRAYARGKSYVDPLVVTYVLKNRLPTTRVGITTSKKVGCAVVRSRCRRVLRAACCGVISRVRPGYDLVLVSRGRTAHAKSGEIERVLARHLKQAGVLLEDPA